MSIFYMICLAFLGGWRSSAEPPMEILKSFISMEAPRTFVPFRISDGFSANYINLIFDTLFLIDQKGKIAGNLAEKWTWIDPLTLEVQLRENVYFHNGEAMNAEAVRFTLDFYINPKFKAESRQYVDSIVSVEAVDRLKVQIRTSFPDRLLPYRLATVGHILPPHYFKARTVEEFSNKPVGTGIFQWMGYDSKKELRVRRNEKYWGSRSEIEEVVFRFFNNFDKPIQLLRRGELQLITHLPGQLTRQLMGVPNLTVTKRLTNQSIVMILNSAKESSPLQNVHFRRAIRDLINAEDVVKYSDMGNGVVSNSLSLPGEPYYEGNFLKRPLSQESKKALRLYRSYPLKMQVTEPLRVVGEILVKQLREVGLTIEMKYGTNQDEVKEVLDYKVRGLVPKIDFLVSHCAHRFPAFPYLVMLPSHGNWSMIKDANLDQMIRYAVEEFNEPSQIDQFRKINRYVYEQALVLPVFQFMDIYAHSNRYRFLPDSTAYLNFKDIRLLSHQTFERP